MFKDKQIFDILSSLTVKIVIKLNAEIECDIIVDKNQGKNVSSCSWNECFELTLMRCAS